MRAHLVAEASDTALDSQLLRQRERELHEKGKEVDRLHDQLASVSLPLFSFIAWSGFCCCMSKSRFLFLIFLD